MAQLSRRELFEAHKQAVIDYNASLEDALVPADQDFIEMYVNTPSNNFAEMAKISESEK